jgi:septal ring factor EnvC (AmiA/AmiB activator)
MDKIKSFAPMMAFCLMFIKVISSKAILQQDVLVLLILAGLFAVMELKRESKQIKSLHEDLDLTKKQLSELNVSLEKNSKRIEEVSTHVGGLKIAQTFRPNAMR